jgi:hypothetical protein
MTAIPTTVVTRAGVDPTAVMQVTTAADTFTADPEVWIRVTNTSAGAVTVTITPSAGTGPAGTTIGPYALPVVPITTGDRIFGPFPPNPFADSSGNVNLTYSSSGATIKIAAFKFSG